MKRASLSAVTVVDEAAILADEAGLDAVTLSAVARRLGVQTPSLYSHVRDHAALLDGITALALDDLGRRIAVEIAGRSRRDALAGLAAAHRALALEAPGRWHALQRRAGPAAVRSEAARDLVALNDAVLRGYGLPDAERVHAIRLIGSTINGFLALEAAGSFDHSDPAPIESWTRAIDALDATLSAWSAGSRTESSSE